MSRRRTALLASVWLVALQALGVAAARAEDDDGAELIELGRPVTSSIPWQDQRWQSFKIRVPDDAMVLSVQLEGAAVDLDLFARHGAPLLDLDEDADHQAVSDLYNEQLRITRGSEPALRGGLYYIDVVYNVEGEPRVGKKRVSEIPFTLTAKAIRARVDGRLDPGRSLSSRTERDSGWFRTFTIEVPKSAQVLRIDLGEVAGDLDIVARRGKPILEREPTDHVADSALGRETLVLDKSSDPPLAPGLWYVNVYDPFELDPVAFEIYARFEATPPGTLLALPTIRAPSDGFDRALLSTVEILSSNGTGSGTLVSPDGLVLTNYHVVEDDSGDVLGKGQLVIGLCLDPKLPTVETFRGSVELADRDLDLALVRIESGLYGQPLPAGYRFPFLELGKPGTLRIGDPIAVLGFPSVGGLGSRASITLTRGVLSGFDTTAQGVLFKTDAGIGSGNSGGAALDGAFRLIGVPTGSVEDTEGYAQLGYLLPVSLLPASWVERIVR